MKEAEQFLTECKLTCFGGSEKGTCGCEKPKECRLTGHPKFSHYKKKADDRLMKFITNSLESSLEGYRDGKS